MTCAGLCSASAFAQSPDAGAASSSSSKSVPSAASKARKAGPALDAGTLSGDVYRNTAFGFTCKVPAGWVERTEEMNESDDDSQDTSQPQGTRGGTEEKRGRVLLAVFSRPPAAHGEDVNASIVIAAESAATYPGLTDAAQYVVGPLTDAAKAQGFHVAGEAYEFTVGSKTLPRADFQKNMARHVVREATVAMLAKRWLVTFTFVAGTDDDLDELMEGLSFGAAKGK